MSTLVNFKNINDKLLEKPIYRVFSLDKFLISLNQNSLYLIKPKFWDDPFEGFLLNQVLWSSRDKKKYFEFDEFYRERFYGQCWTFRSESNFLWKIYAPYKNGIIVKSTITKLMEYLTEMPGGNTYIGKVVYLNENQIKKRFSRIESLKDFESLIVDSLLTKRTEFKEEQELRIIYFSKYSAHKDPTPVGLSYDKSYKNIGDVLFDEIIVDPRIDKIRYNHIISIIRQLGYNGQVRRSTLYDKPIFQIVIKL
jgi:hypothetical protein